MRWGEVNSTWWWERSKVKVLFPSATIFFRYFNLFSFAKSWWNDLERIMPVVLGISWSYSMQCEGPAACPKNYEIEWRLILDVLQCHSLNLIFYELSPFSSDFPSLPPAMLLCNDLCRARDFTFSLFFTCGEYVSPYRHWKTNTFQNSSFKVFLHYITNQSASWLSQGIGMLFLGFFWEVWSPVITTTLFDLGSFQLTSLPKGEDANKHVTVYFKKVCISNTI